MLQQLILCVQSYNVGSDPCIQMLRKQPETKVEAEIVAASGKTYCAEQLNKFLEQSWHIYEELGGCATDFFIDACISQLRNSTISEMEMSELNREERAYILQVLAPIWVPAEITDDTNPMPLFSSKFETLLQFLLKMDHSEFSGLIFVRRRITVSVLTAILSNHPSTKQRFRCAPYVGGSNNGGRESIGDLLSRNIQKDTLTEFRGGIKNIIVATDVLEEGLDVSRCSLVICFDKPSNLKSFVQRRGRARHQESTYAIMTSTDDETLNVQKWQDLERMMVEAYQDDERQRADVLALEDIDEDVAEYIDVPSTG
jgi:superfamily II DNA/RNA helicase